MKKLFEEIANFYKKITSKSLSRTYPLDRLLLDLNLPSKNILYISKTEAEYGGFAGLSHKIVRLLDERGIKSLYRHQTEAITLALSGQDFVIATQTASGKTMCYNLPVLQNILDDEKTTALYLFPTKALAHDQLTGFNSMSRALFGKRLGYAYDGDTDRKDRPKTREEANVIITNPDMLHTSILPNHAKWERYFANLKYVVVDELHTYRGIFGSHIANLFIRLDRICKYYGSHPTFICATATISNPIAHAEALTGRKMHLIDKSTAGEANRVVALFNPREKYGKYEKKNNAITETSDLAVKAISSGVSTIVFARSRVAVEILLPTIREKLTQIGLDTNLVMSYRGGYLPQERRRIEKELREGKLLCVVSTNALELGIDIGSLSCVIMHGFPPTIASSWQEIGRAGRRGEGSLAIVVATASPRDQFYTKNPNFFFQAPPEKALIDPSNPYILSSHVLCATHELPFCSGETFGNYDISSLLDTFVASEKILKVDKAAYSKFLWQGTTPPALGVSLRSISGKAYIIRDTSKKRTKAIGTLDEIGATTMLFPGAIYFDCGVSYKVQSINMGSKLCLVEPCEESYYTLGQTSLDVTVANPLEENRLGGFGDVSVTITPSIYKKIDFATQKVTGIGEIHLPRVTFATKGTWFFLPTVKDLKVTSFTLRGITHILELVASHILMCNIYDLIIYGSNNDANFDRPTVHIIDKARGGVGLAEGAWQDLEAIIDKALALVKGCDCKQGCPSCIGAMESEKEKSKIQAILSNLATSIRREQSVL